MRVAQRVREDRPDAPTILHLSLPQALHLVTVILGRPSPSGSRNCRLITAASTGETGYHEFPVPQFPNDEPWEVETEGPFWATYLKGVVALMNRSGSIPPFDAIIATSVPLGGGLSSSAALEAATYHFIEQLCPRLKLSPKDVAQLCQEAEERYVHNHPGSSDRLSARESSTSIDQLTSLMATDKNLLSIDCRYSTTNLIVSTYIHIVRCKFVNINSPLC